VQAFQKLCKREFQVEQWVLFHSRSKNLWQNKTADVAGRSIQEFTNNQKLNLNPSCTSRGPMDVFVIAPKFPSSTEVFGVPKTG